MCVRVCRESGTLTSLPGNFKKNPNCEKGIANCVLGEREGFLGDKIRQDMKGQTDRRRRGRGKGEEGRMEGRKEGRNKGFSACNSYLRQEEEEKKKNKVVVKKKGFKRMRR